MSRMQKCIKNILITAFVLAGAFIISLVFQHVFEIEERITTLFVFAVFLISMLTEGYIYGIVSAIAGVLAVNYAFTFPFFEFDFATPVNVMSAIVMIVLAILTSTLTTKVKQHEAFKAESEKERMRANLLRAVSHDLRTPLTTIYSSASALADNRENLSVQQQDEILNAIKEDSEWLVSMVENLLSITKLGTGNVKINKKPVVLEELIDSVIFKFKKRYPSHDVIIDIPGDIVMIPMDAMLIEQVIINLLENAVQHATGMKHLWLSVFVIGNNAVFEIKDDGCGVSDEAMKSMFSGAYVSKASVPDGNRNNAGIGLSVCETIIKAHGGDIRASNSMNKGAVFRFTLGMEEN